MREQIRRVLDMVARERLSPADAGALLGALSGKLSFSPERWEQLFALLGEGGFSPEELAVLLETRAGVRRGPAVDFESAMEDMPRAVREAMNAMNQAFSGRGRPARPGNTLRVQVEEADGSELRANLPLSLAEHAAKLLPPRVLDALARNGITAEALTMLLTANPPAGELLSVEGPDGSEVSLRVE